SREQPHALRPQNDEHSFRGLGRIRGAAATVMILGVEERSGLHHLGLWWMAVWALRLGYVGLAVAMVCLVALAVEPTPWGLALGGIVWIGTVPVTLTGFLLARHELPEPRPKLWSMRLMLVHDSVHSVSRRRQG